MQDDPRAAFTAPPVRLDSPLGPLDLGVVDVKAPGIAEGVSRLLERSIQDARAEVGGHLPSWLVDDIERNYISPEKVRTLWADTGHRFALVLEQEIVGTIHIAKSPTMILTVDRNVVNVDEAEHPGFKPPGHHHVVNISLRHELRRAHLGARMVAGIAHHFRHLFTGEGLWVRADPPWHPGLSGLGFVHDPSFDVFLPPSAERTAGLPHEAFNRRYACACGTPRPELATHKLQYVSMTRPFALTARAAIMAAPPRFEPPTAEDTRDFGGLVTMTPQDGVRPRTIDELAEALAWAASARRRVTIRGRGQSHAGQSLGNEIQLSTEHLDRLVSADARRVTMEGGMTWRALAAATRFLPAVTPTIGEASIAGALSSFGLGFGSIRHGLAIDHVESLLVVTGDGRKVECSRKQAGWLFEAVLGGYGQFGVIARATFRVGELLRVGPAHITSITSPESLAWSADTLDASARVTAEGIGLRRTVAGESPLSIDLTRRPITRPEGPTMVAHVILPQDALEPYVAYVRGLLVHGADALWIHPFVHRKGRASLFFPRLDVTDGALTFSVNLWREIRGRDLVALHAENHRLVTEAKRLGGAPTLQNGGVLPIDPRILRAKLLADPGNILASPHLYWPE